MKYRSAMFFCISGLLPVVALQTSHLLLLIIWKRKIASLELTGNLVWKFFNRFYCRGDGTGKMESSS